MVRSIGSFLALAALWAVTTILCGSESVQAMTILTFDELPPQSVDGLTFQGVTFGYQGGSFTNYNGFSGPITAVYLDRPYLDGDAAGILTLDFATPTSILEFGVALRNGNPLTPALTVELFDANLMSLGTIPVDTQPLIAFTEAKFVHGGTPVSRAVLDFDETASNFFHIDNLTYVPEPSGLILASVGLVGLILCWRRGGRRSEVRA
jgi:hypothetical protein